MAKFRTFEEIKFELELDGKCINSLYNDVIGTSPNNYSSFDEYSKIFELLVKRYILFDDYLHSNNLIQIFKLNLRGNTTKIPEWMKYYSILIYSKRSIKYYLDNPNIFWESIMDLANSESDEYVQRVDNLIVETLEFYKEEYVKYPEFLHNSIRKFVREYLRGREYSSSATAHVKELEKLSSSININNVVEVYNNLPSKTIDLIEDLEKDVENLKELKEQAKEIHDDFYGDIGLAEEDHHKKIYVIGGDAFLHQKDKIYGIGKKYNIKKQQFEIINDYDKITNEGENIIRSTYYNSKVIGIIFGSIPHSTSGNEGASSLIAKCTQEEGFPITIVCRENNDAAKPKISKSNFAKAIRDLIIKYKVK